MTHQTRSVLVRYSVAVLANVVVVVINDLLGLREHYSSALFLAAVAGSAWYGGLGPGLVATVLGAATLDYFYLDEQWKLDLGPHTWLWLVIFIGVAVFLNIQQEAHRRMTTQLKLESERKNRFMAVLAHELRNFLSPVASAVAVLDRQSDRDPLTAEMCAVIDRQIGNMASLINDLLDAGRIAQGKLRLAIKPLDLRRALTDAVQCVRPLIEQRGQTLQMNVAQTPLVIRGDRTRLEQVFVNLLRNAAKYTDPGGNISVSAAAEASEIVVRVKDDGQGIPPELLPHIFELFMQERPGAHGGLGVGLSLVRGLVKRHGGTVTAVSDGPGCGAEFVVRLPASADTLNAVPSDSTEPTDIDGSGEFPALADANR